MQNKKVNRIFAGIIIALVVLIIIFILISNYSKDNMSLSIAEKSWINNNVNNVIDVNVFNDVPVYGYNGSGIIFDFLDRLSNDYHINFNKKPYYLSDSPNYSSVSFRVIDDSNQLSDKEILLYEDDYVVLSSSDDNFSISNVDKLRIGVLAFDKDKIVNYFSLDDNSNIIDYKVIDGMMLSLLTGDINYVIVPNMMYMNKILSNKLNVVYHISDIKNKYVIDVKDDMLFGIFNKYYNKYYESYFKQDYSKNYLNVYFGSSKVDSVNQKNYNGVIYKYGYVVNMPYENYDNNKFVGTLSSYLASFEDIHDVEIKAIRYSSVDDLKSALVNGEVDFALTNFDYLNFNFDYVITNKFINDKYVVLSNKDITINSIKGLRDYEVSMVGSSNLYTLSNNKIVNMKLFKDTNDLLRNIDSDSVILIDYNTYLYYKNDKLSSYKVVYSSDVDDGYRFIVNKKYETLASMLNYYVGSNNYDYYKYRYNTSVMIDNDYTSLGGAIMIIVIIIILVITSVILIKKKSIVNNVSRDDKFKYIDSMTSLKNRTYLNDNIYKWDDNVIFPQSIIVIDIDSMKEINDKFGREVGDEVIKGVSGILINNQLENTDIVRSGGDEFIIYMMGYDLKETSEYAKKIVRLSKGIPNGEGVSAGYSMITDEVKSVDDAINESIIMLEKNKEKKQSK